jgi:large subunit ribosomal protein L13
MIGLDALLTILSDFGYMKTVIANPKTLEPVWYLVDVADKTLGRVATQIASYLKGKNNTNYTPHVLTGPRIIIINSAKIHVTRKKRENKVYRHYTGYPGGLKSESFERLFARFPTRVIEKAIKGMLPKNALGRGAFKRLRVYPSDIHPHAPQRPTILELH